MNDPDCQVIDRSGAVDCASGRLYSDSPLWTAWDYFVLVIGVAIFLALLVHLVRSIARALLQKRR